MKPPIVVFDLDGTLVDTAPDLLDSLNHALRHGDLGNVPRNGFERFVGQGARVMIERAFEDQGSAATAETLDFLMKCFLEHYGAGMPGKSRPYDHVMNAAAAIADAGFLLAVCTNKTEELAIRLLNALKIDTAFAAICGQDTFLVRKPDPDHLFGTIDMAGGNRDRAVMIGDSQTDILTAKAAGIPVIAVDFGYTDRHVSEFGPDHVISDFRALDRDLVESLLDRRTHTG